MMRNSLRPGCDFLDLEAKLFADSSLFIKMSHMILSRRRVSPSIWVPCWDWLLVTFTHVPLQSLLFQVSVYRYSAAIAWLESRQLRTNKAKIGFVRAKASALWNLPCKVSIVISQDTVLTIPLMILAYSHISRFDLVGKRPGSCKPALRKYSACAGFIRQWRPILSAQVLVPTKENVRVRFAVL